MSRNHALIILVIILSMGIPTQSGLAATTERVSIASDGTEGNDKSVFPSISADGRYVTFISTADNLVTNDTNYCDDVFVHDLLTGVTERVSISSASVQGNARSEWPSISTDGRYVAYNSMASNLILDDTNGCDDIFIHDRLTGSTERISVASDGTQGDKESVRPHISGDGRYVAFDSLANNLFFGDTGYTDVFVHNLLTGITERISVPNGDDQVNDGSYNSAISADGRYVCFSSPSGNLVAGDTNDEWDVFLRDRMTDTTERVSVASDNSEGNDLSWNSSISADGRYVTFDSFANNLVPDDTNWSEDVFVRDRYMDITERFSISKNGTQGDDWSCESSISADGRFVVFISGASNLVPDDTNWTSDVFVHDRLTGTIEIISVASDGTQGNESCLNPSISADGRYVTFFTSSDNLVPGDTNGTKDVFVRDRTSDVSGAVTLQNYTVDPSGISIAVSAREIGGMIINTNPILGDDGSYSMEKVQHGTYDIAFKGSHWLRKVVPGVVVSGDITGVDASLINGDCNNDNMISAADLIIVRKAYGTTPGSPKWDARADLNGDGMVSAEDLIIVRKSYGKVGDS